MRIFTLLGIIFSLLIVYQPTHTEAGTYSTAKRYVGLHEHKNTGTIRKVVGVNPRRVPWCGYFAGSVVKKNGMSPPKGYGRAAAWKRWGHGVRNARKGDVVVIRTRRGHHVGFYAGRSKGKVLLVGGNQSNRVKVSSYSARSVVAIRRGKLVKPEYRKRTVVKSNRNIRKVKLKNTRFGKFIRKLRSRT